MKPKHFFLWAVSAFIALSGLVSCSDDGDLLPGGDGGDGTGADSIGLVFSYDKFLTPDDVQIVSADTSVIAVSRAFLESQNIEVTPGRAVCIWRTINTEPFIRIVDGVRDDGTTLTLTTRSGDMGDMWADLDIKMDTELYVDSTVQSPPLRAEGAVGPAGVDFRRYMDADSVLHPAVIIVTDDSLINAGGSPQAFTAEELLAENSRFSFLDIHIKDCKANIPISTHGKFFINFLFNAEAGLNLEAKVKRFKLKKFECSLSGYVQTSLTAGVEISKPAQPLKKDIELAKFPRYTAVFWCGPIPVAVSLNSGLKWINEALFSAQGTVSATASVRADYKEGVIYEGGWNAVSSSSVTTSAGLDKVETSISGRLTSGVMLFANVMLYGCAGPEIGIGPYVESNVKAAVNWTETPPTVHLTTDGTINVGGQIGAKLKIWKWTIGDWSTRFSFWKKQVWNLEKTYAL